MGSIAACPVFAARRLLCSPASASTTTRASNAGTSPASRRACVGELSTRSETFRTRWAAHNVRFHDSGVKRFRHPVVGDLTLTFETMPLAADDGLILFVYTADVGSKSEEALNLLASWAATLDQEAEHGDHEEQHRDEDRAG
jgi:MmyB-like transcription regulator ligand binding domain